MPLNFTGKTQAWSQHPKRCQWALFHMRCYLGSNNHGKVNANTVNVSAIKSSNNDITQNLHTQLVNQVLLACVGKFKRQHWFSTDLLFFV